MKLKKLLGDEHLTCSIEDSDKDLRIKEIEVLLNDARSLLDGAYEVVELFNPETPSQVEWKQKWLEGARKHGASGL